MEEAGALLAWICQTAGTRRDVIIAGIALLPEAARLQGQTLHTESFEPQENKFAQEITCGAPSSTGATSHGQDLRIEWSGRGTLSSDDISEFGYVTEKRENLN
ncbi:unnamed protein product [Clonostachys chloroleuca]|uniref:Uncharacterized protein n=1 Tax=Clonostachys chloroleuca TaxID=1926264 RepID=A0AA35Q2E7_9HYPO|nr:unnamed protein product [Clonostachys chloroleuca]